MELFSVSPLPVLYKKNWCEFANGTISSSSTMCASSHGFGCLVESLNNTWLLINNLHVFSLVHDIIVFVYKLYVMSQGR